MIIGIGNYNKKLFYTRHNVGIWFINKIINNKFKKYIKFNKIYKIKLNKKKIYLYVPKSYINNVGIHILNIKKKFKIKNKNILIINDEINLKPGKIKIRFNINKNNTHKGIKDIIKYINNKKFYNLRIGIGKPKNIKKLKYFVLNKPLKIEKKLIYKSIKKSIKYIKLLFLLKNKNFKYIQNLINS